MPRASPGGFHALRSLRHRNYRLFFAGQLVSVAGTRMQVVAQGWLVLTLTNDPFALGVVVAAQYGPLLFLGLFGGLLADAVPKRPTLVATQGAEMILSFLLFALTATGVVAVWHIVAIALALGVVAAVDTPVRQSFAIEMVGREDVGNAIALNVSTFNLARVIGPAIAGVLIATTDLSFVFLVNGLTYAAVILALLAMRPDTLQPATTSPRPRNATEVLGSVAEGLSYVGRSPVVLVTVVILGFVSIFGINLQVLGPPLARDVLGSDAAGYGFLMSGFGIGSLVSAVSITVLGTSPRTVVAGAVALGIAEVALGLSRSLPLSLGLAAIAGVGAVAVAATGNVTLQLAAPDQMRGRVMSVYAVVFDGTAPIGGLLMGAIASNAGAAVAIAVGGAASAVTGLAGWIWLRRIAGRTAPSEVAVTRP